MLFMVALVVALLPSMLEAQTSRIIGRVVRGSASGPGIANWMVIKTPAEGLGMDTVLTDEVGNFVFDGLEGGGLTYRIIIEIPSGWYAINAIAGRHLINGVNGEISYAMRVDNHTLDVYVDGGAVNIDNIFVLGDETDFSSFRSFSPDDLIEFVNGKLIKPVKRNKGLPNLANLLSEVVVMGGFAPLESESDEAGGLRVGVSFMQDVGFDNWKPSSAQVKYNSWVRLSKWNFARGLGKGFADIQKTLYDRTGRHTGAPRALDSLFRKGRPYKLLAGEKKILQPKNHNNRLFAEVVALKFNIAASRLGKTPAGFGELVYDEPGPLRGLRISQISCMADSALTLWREFQWNYLMLDSVIRKINRAFRGPFDAFAIVSNEKTEGVILNGARPLFEVSFLRPAAMPPSRTTPRALTGEIEGTPDRYSLQQNYPNPFNPTTSIRYELVEPGLVTLKVFNMLGQEIATLLDGELVDAGFDIVDFEADDLASGTYVYRISVTNPETGELSFVQAKQMILIK
jgi:hypothetical protein